jgi:hypothetical protein
MVISTFFIKCLVISIGRFIFASQFKNKVMLKFTEIVDKTGEVIGYDAKNGKYPFSIVRLKRGEGYVFSLYVTKKNDEWRVGQYDTLEKAVKAADKYNTKKD